MPKKNTAPRPESKIARVIHLLGRDGGASLAELVTATGWQPHTMRAALTGLRKKGHSVTKVSAEGVTRYSVTTEARK
jgi:DNA-binding MarR family transcriptional regulator